MTIFREKNLDRVTSPEQLNDYIRTAGPGIWLLLAGMLLLLLGACVWGVFGSLETAVHTGAVCRDGILTCYIREADAEGLAPGLEVTVNGKTFPLETVSAIPSQLPAETDAYALHLGALEAGDWAYTAAAETDLPDGVYEAVIVTERTAPITFIMN